MKNFIVFISLFLFACTDENSTVQTLKKNGFTQVKTTGYSFLSCSEDDMFSTGFTAVNSSGEKVSGTVCCGLFKNCTIRW